MKGIKINYYALSYDDCSIRVYRLFTTIFHKLLNIAIITLLYYAGIMLNAVSDLLCSKLCWHNSRVPTKHIPHRETDRETHITDANRDTHTHIHRQTDTCLCRTWWNLFSLSLGRLGWIPNGGVRWEAFSGCIGQHTMTTHDHHHYSTMISY